MSMKFRTSIDKTMQNIERDTHAQIKDVVNDLWRRIVSRNPVDTGFSSGNWNIGYKADFTVRGDKENPPEIRNPLQNVKRIPNNMTSIHITNGVDYIEVLEHGRVGNKGSLQAPNGFVGLSIAEIEAKYQ